MKFLLTTRLTFLWAVVLLAIAALSSPAAGQAPAETSTPTAVRSDAVQPSPGTTADMRPTGVQPDRVVNNVATELIVTGVGFADGAVVVIDGLGGLETTFVSSNLLRAILPADGSPGVYTLTVVNPDATAASLADALTVSAPAPTAGPTDTPAPTNTPAPTAFVRPLVVVNSYGASSAVITPGQDLDFEITLANSGQSRATNVVATFVAGEFVPRVTGGVRAVGLLEPGQTARFWQPLAASRDLSGKNIGTLEVKVDYTDVNGTTYSESFALTFPVAPPAGAGATATPTPTATATPTTGPRLRPQLLITDYQSDVEKLEPGTAFTLQLNIENQGNADARRVTMILGGGSNGSSPPEGTPEAGGGLSGAGGEFTNFAPVGSSNVQFLGDLTAGDSQRARQALIVNASTKPGAYPVKVSFVYNDGQGSSFVDDQVITLLVFSQPSVEINFYMPPPPFVAGQPGQLPLQLVNTGKSAAVFGNFRVTAADAPVENNSVFVGALEPGGFFPLDAQIIPEQPGSLDLLAAVNYTDDFNQPQVLTRTLTIEVMEGMGFEEPIEPFPGEAGPPLEPVAETLAQRIWRFIRGFIGLDSGIPQPQPEFPIPGEGEPFPEGPPPIDVGP